MYDTECGLEAEKKYWQEVAEVIRGEAVVTRTSAEATRVEGKKSSILHVKLTRLGYGLGGE